MEEAIVALATSRNFEEAARNVGVAPKTLQRWQKLPEFEAAFRSARTAVFRQSLLKLEQASVPAVTTLLKIMIDPSASAAIRARCAYYILDLTRKAVETEELESRLAELERVAESSTEHN